MSKSPRLTLDELMPDLAMVTQASRGGKIWLPPDQNRKLTPEEESYYKRSELDLESTLSEVLSRKSRVSPDLRIDDRDLPEFPNFYQFCMSKQGMDQKPFARQLTIATHLLAEWCPHCSTKKFHNILNVPVDAKVEDFPERVTFLEHGVCPKCGARKSELVRDGHLNFYQELAGCGGQRSGKSALLGLIGPYMIHRWLKLQKPVQVMGLMKNSILVGTFCALTYQKAQELLWQPVINAIQDSPWFQAYHELLDHYSEKYDEENLYKFKDSFLSYNFRNLYFHPSGPNKRTLRGATRIWSAIDEIGWFPHGEDNDQMERASANEVYVSLDRSLKTVRKSALKLLLEDGMDNVPMAYACNISSPSSYMDKIMTLVRSHVGSRDVFTYHLPTWGMNPLFTKEDFSKEYRDNPVKAERDFGANPPMSENPWFSDMTPIRQSMTVKNWKLGYAYKHTKSLSGTTQRYGEVTHVKVPSPCPATLLAMDAGYSNNSFGVAIGRPIVMPSRDGGERYGCQVVAVAEIAPRRGQNVINYNKMVNEFVYDLIDKFNVVGVIGDRWQSIKTLSDIEEDKGIQTEVYSLTGEDFTLIGEMLSDDTRNYITLPAPEISFDEILSVDLDDYPHCFKYKPAAHLYHQFTTVTLDSRGVVQKGQGYTDDLVRATSLCIAYCTNEEIIETYQLLQRSQTTVARALGVKSGSGGGARSSSAIGVRK